MSTPTYAGHTFELRIDNGVVFRNSYTPDGTGLHYEVLEGPTAAAAETVSLHRRGRCRHLHRGLAGDSA
jgi:hypothetical protein